MADAIHTVDEENCQPENVARYVKRLKGLKNVDAKAKFYLEHLIELLEQGKFINAKKGFFGNYVFFKNVVEPNGCYDVEKIQEALSTLYLEADQKVYDVYLEK